MDQRRVSPLHQPCWFSWCSKQVDLGIWDDIMMWNSTSSPQWHWSFNLRILPKQADFEWKMTYEFYTSFIHQSSCIWSINIISVIHSYYYNSMCIYECIYIYIYNKYVDIYLCICENLTRKMWASFFFWWVVVRIIGDGFSVRWSSLEMTAL